MSFDNRWLIEGELTTHTPLRVGDGGTREEVDKRDDHRFDVSTVATDVTGRPYLPGSTIKGAVKPFWAKRGLAPDILAILFGSESKVNTGSQQRVVTKPAKAEFWNTQDARVQDQPTLEKIEKWTPYWNKDRLTGTMTGTAINRRARVVREEKLFHQEFVPPGVSFRMAISGQDQAEIAECKGDEGLMELLCALHAFNLWNEQSGLEEESLALGSHTDDGWGRLHWKPTIIRRIDAAGVRRWMENGAVIAGYGMLEPISADKLQALMKEAQNRFQERMKGCPRQRLSFRLRLGFKEGFAVNDPFQTGKGEDVAKHSPLRDINGAPLLPGRSFKGAFRSQAERILRTMDERLLQGRGGKKIACHVDDPDESCKAIYYVKEVKKLCLACQMFGAPGWRSPFKRSAFLSVGRQDLLRQELIANDRFTGKVAGSKKFNAETFYQPTLSGAIGLDCQALKSITAERWGIGLLLLTLKDLMEGDITFGFGQGKGYGANSVYVEKVFLPASVSPQERPLLEALRKLETPGYANDPELRGAVQALEQAIQAAFK